MRESAKDTHCAFEGCTKLQGRSEGRTCKKFCKKWRCDVHRRLHHCTEKTNSSNSSEITPIFESSLTKHSHLSIEKRVSIVAFHRIGMKKSEIMQRLECSMPSINHWLVHYDRHKNLDENDRVGNN